jgi:hypothetical protein
MRAEILKIKDSVVVHIYPEKDSIWRIAEIWGDQVEVRDYWSHALISVYRFGELVGYFFVKTYTFEGETAGNVHVYGNLPLPNGDECCTY